MPIVRGKIDGRETFTVVVDALVACFVRRLRPDVVRTIEACSPVRGGFPDNAFAAAAGPMNAEQIFNAFRPWIRSHE